MSLPRLRLQHRRAPDAVARPAGSGADEAGDGFGGFPDLGLAFLAALGYGFGHAVTKVIFEQAEGDRLQRPGDGGDLSEYVYAVHVFVNHALQTSDLALDPAQALEVGVFVLAVSAHA